jgi:hypothetical protein
MLTLDLAEDILHKRGLGEGVSQEERVEAFSFIFKNGRLGYLNKTLTREAWDLVDNGILSEDGEILDDE